MTGGLVTQPLDVWPLTPDLLASDKAYILSTPTGIYVWCGTGSSLRGSPSLRGADWVAVREGREPFLFRNAFRGWR